MKKAIIYVLIVVLLAIVGGGIFLYITRPPSAPSTVTPNNTTLTASSSDEIIYRINPERSVVRFEIDEMLRGSPFTVIGTTTQISGDIIVSPTQFVIGTMKVNARTFKTDSPQRDGAISRLIVKSENPANEFITFVPKNFSNASFAPDGKTMLLTVTGDLTLAGITKSVSIDVAVLENSDELAAMGEATVKRSDFGLTIPNIPFVSDVPDEFKVSAEIVAEKVSK